MLSRISLLLAIFLYTSRSEKGGDVKLIKAQNNQELLNELKENDMLEDDVFPIMENKPNKEPFQAWNDETCSNIVHLFTVTGDAIKRIRGEIKDKKHSKDKATQLKLKALKMITEELIESERWIFSALHMLKETVKSSAANSLDQIVQNTKLRLEDLQYATIREEEKCDQLEVVLFQLRDLKNSSSNDHNLFYDIIEDVLQDVGHAADKLETNLREKLVPIKSHDIETVKKLPQRDSEETIQNLEDIHGNRYVISLPADKTQPLTDPTLLYSLVNLLLVSGVFSTLCHLLWIPTIFGQILCGVVLGPSCLNVILDPVQTETIGEIGVFLILFCCGLEFSPKSLVKVWRISVGGSISIILMITLAFTICGALFNIPLYQSVFVALCLSFSSTALIIKFLHDDKSDDVAGLRDSMLGMLVLQDIEISLIMGLLPLLTSEKTPRHRLKVTEPHVHIRKLMSVADTSDQGLDKGTLVFVVLFAVISIGIMVLVGKRCLALCFKLLNKKATAEIDTLLPLSLCFGVVFVTEHLGISMEVGCFLSGVLIKFLGKEVTTLRLVSPIRDVFAVLFFSGIGLHVYPLFVWSQLSLIIILTLFVVSIKYLVCLLVLQPLTSDLQRSVISAGLAQVSEFSFVLASRGRKLQLVNREVYLLILSVTAASLVISPILWKISLLHARRKKDLLRITGVRPS